MLGTWLWLHMASATAHHVHSSCRWCCCTAGLVRYLVTWCINISDRLKIVISYWKLVIPCDSSIYSTGLSSFFRVNLLADCWLGMMVSSISCMVGLELLVPIYISASWWLSRLVSLSQITLCGLGRVCELVCHAIGGTALRAARACEVACVGLVGQVSGP